MIVSPKADPGHVAEARELFEVRGDAAGEVDHDRLAGEREVEAVHAGPAEQRLDVLERVDAVRAAVAEAEGPVGQSGPPSRSSSPR